MKTTTATNSILFKLYLAPGATEQISIEYSNLQQLIEKLELKLGELGLNFNVVFWKNDKGNLISMSQNAQRVLKKMANRDSASIFVIADSDSSDSSSDSSDSGDEDVIIADAPEVAPHRRHCGRRDRSRSRGFDRSRSRSRSRSNFHDHHKRHQMKKLMWKRFQESHGHPEFKRRHCFGGRRARSASPIGRRPCREGEEFKRHPLGSFGTPCGREEFEGPTGGFGRPFGRRGMDHHGFNFHRHHHPFGAFHGFGGHHHGFGHGFGHHGFKRQHPFERRFGRC